MGKEADGEKKIECRLCRKKKKPTDWRGMGEIDSWVRVCKICIGYWEVGKKTEKATKADGKNVFIQVKLKFKMDGKEGDPKANIEIRAKDISAAMGAVKLRGTSSGGTFSCEESDIRIGGSGEHDWGGSERMQVPESRAVAMKKVLACFMNAMTKARLDGYDSGRNLLTGLADGSVTPDDFSEASDKVRDRKKPWGY